MKNIYKLLTLISLITLTSCNQNNNQSNSLSYDPLTIICPSGAPSLPFYDYALDAGESYFETNNNASNIVPIMMSGTNDVVVLPTNVGIQAIVNKKAPYLIAATITFGNLYIGQTGNDQDGVMDENDYIVSFQQGGVPDLLFKYIYGETIYNNVHYVDSSSSAAGCLKSGINVADDNASVDYVLLAEPALSKVLAKSNATIYANIQDEYKKKSAGLEIFQASIFVKNTLDYNQVDSFLNDIELDVQVALSYPQIFEDKLSRYSNEEVIFSIDIASAISLTSNGNKLGLGFKRARNNLKSVNNFLSVFNIGEIDEKITF